MGRFKAVILAGGSGERFWPLSTPERPKQFLDVFGGGSLIRQAFERLRGLAAPEDVFVVTSAALAAATRRELPELPRGNVVGEPMRRDTGAAVALGVGVAGGDDSDVLAFLPADQLVAKPAAFRSALSRAAMRARREDSVVVLGIKPTGPATAYGYVDPARGTFVEKPDAQRAKRYLKAGYLWNAGMFIARAGTFRAAFAAHAPALSPLAVRPPRGRRLADFYEALPRISFDYAVMEKIPRVAVVKGDFGWDDVGGYGAFDRHFPRDAAGNVLQGRCAAVDSEGSVCVARGARITLLGVRNLVVVSTPNEVLVVDKSHLSDMKKLFR